MSRHPLSARHPLIFVLSILPLVSTLGCVADDPVASVQKDGAMVDMDGATMDVVATADGGLDAVETTPPVAFMIDEPASFQSYRLDEGWGPCQVSTPGACQRHVVIARDGAVEGADQGAVFAGRLTAAELDAFVALVIGEPVLTELLDDKPCGVGADYSDAVTIGLAPGLRLVQTTTGCGGQGVGGSTTNPIAAMNAAARAIALKFAGQTTAPPATTPIAPSVTGGRLRFQPQLTYLERTWAPAGCASGASCQSGMSVDVHIDLAGISREGRSRRWLDVDDFSPLAATAISPEVIAAFRNPASCPAAGGARDQWQIGISPSGIIVEADVAGCLDGPVEQLRAAATTLFDRLSASAAPPTDASTDHPPDGGADAP
jgi:hypothetical protein